MSHETRRTQLALIIFDHLLWKLCAQRGGLSVVRRGAGGTDKILRLSWTHAPNARVG